MALKEIRPRTWLTLLILVLSAYRLSVIGSIPLSPDEAYYWAWSRRLAFCYYDQPGLVAWLDWLFSLPFPTATAFTIRLAAVCLSALTALLVYRGYREYREDEGEAALFAGVFSALPFTWLTGIIMIHDTALLPGLALTFWMLVRLAKYDGRPRDWLALALALTVAMCAKFSAVMVVWGLLLYMVVSPKGRRWWRTWPPYAAGLLAAVLYSPVLLWNYRHGWISLHAVSELTAGPDLTLLRRLRFCLEYVSSQVGIFTPLLGLTVFAALGKGIRDAFRQPDDDQVALPVCLALPVFLYFLQLSLRSHVFGNWPGIAYLPISMLAMREAARAWKTGRGAWVFKRKYLLAAFGLNLLLIFLVMLHLQLRLFRPVFAALEEKYDLPARIDNRLDKDFGGWQEMVALVEGAREPDEFILARNYQVASMLEFMLPGQPFVECYNAGQRGNQWDLWSQLGEKKGQNALVVDFRKLAKVAKERFTAVEPIVAPAVVGDPKRPIKLWFLYHGRSWKGP